MRAMVLERLGTSLVLRERTLLEPPQGDVRIAIEACAVFRTDLHVVDSELADPRTPIVPGHQIADMIDAIGEGVTSFAIRDRVAVPWLGSTCGVCA